MAPADPLAPYNAKRDFSRTREPRGKVAKTGGRSFVVQKHAATRLHWDFRLEIDGVLWVDLTTELYSSGIELLAEPYGHALTIDAGDSPVQLQECVIPYDGREVP